MTYCLRWTEAPPLDSGVPLASPFQTHHTIAITKPPTPIHSFSSLPLLLFLSLSLSTPSLHAYKTLLSLVPVFPLFPTKTFVLPIPNCRFIVSLPAPPMSSGGPTSSSNTSPRIAGPTTTRRRVPDNIVDAEKQSSYSDFSDQDEDDADDSVPGGGSHHHHHLHHHVIKYLLFRTRILFCLPDSFLLHIERLHLWAATLTQSWRSCKNMGRKILAILMLLVVMSVFCKVSLVGVGRGVNRRSIENGQLILQRFKKDWASAQKVVTESETTIPKRVLERLPVSHFLLLLFLGSEFGFIISIFLGLLFIKFIESNSSPAFRFPRI